MFTYPRKWASIYEAWIFLCFNKLRLTVAMTHIRINFGTVQNLNMQGPGVSLWLVRKRGEKGNLEMGEKTKDDFGNIFLLLCQEINS